jgi:hypothetical protein
MSGCVSKWLLELMIFCQDTTTLRQTCNDCLQISYPGDAACAGNERGYPGATALRVPPDNYA